MIGLGIMGRNLLLNMADHGFRVAGYNRDPKKLDELRREMGARDIFTAETIEKLVGLLRKPRVVMMLVSAGNAVDAVIHELLPRLESGDIVIDGGNSHFRDTDRRVKFLAEKNIHFLGVGVSGGEFGARHGPSIMPGGDKNAYARVQKIFEAIAARVNDEPCVAHLGPNSAGHFVKMVHNGIEYGVMQLIAETYDLLKRGANFSNDELAETFADWNRGELNSFLIEITAEIFRKIDEKTKKPLVDLIRDVARQKGTGAWTSHAALELQVPAPTIDMAVAMRDLSVFKSEREAAAKIFGEAAAKISTKRDDFARQVRDALFAAMIVTYAQGMALLRAASKTYGYGLKLDEVAKIWRGGCIIRASVLEDMRAAFRANSELANLILDKKIAEKLAPRMENLRAVARISADSGIPAPALTASLAYFDAFRSEKSPANLIQAQRDYFGAHTYERVDADGTFHTDWRRE
jgi:6-phosphogluconate dehydrogenase